MENISPEQLIESIIAANKLDLNQPIFGKRQSVLEVMKIQLHNKCITLYDLADLDIQIKEIQELLPQIYKTTKRSILGGKEYFYEHIYDQRMSECFHQTMDALIYSVIAGGIFNFFCQENFLLPYEDFFWDIRRYVYAGTLTFPFHRALSTGLEYYYKILQKEMKRNKSKEKINQYKYASPRAALVYLLDKRSTRLIKRLLLQRIKLMSLAYLFYIIFNFFKDYDTWRREKNRKIISSVLNKIVTDGFSFFMYPLLGIFSKKMLLEIVLQNLSNKTYYENL